MAFLRLHWLLPVVYAIYGLCLTVLTFRLIFKRSIDLFPFLLRFLVPFVVMVMAIGSVDLIVSDEVEAFALVLMTLERLIFVLSPLGIVLWLMNRKSEAFLVGLDELKKLDSCSPKSSIIEQLQLFELKLCLCGRSFSYAGYWFLELVDMLV